MNPYENQTPKGEQIRTMFDNIAHRYDMLNHLMTIGIDRGWRRKTVRMVGSGLKYTAADCRAARILDLATGTGDLAIALARKIEQAHITGGDISQGMLDVAKAKVADKGLAERISLTQAEAEALPFADGEFDAATVAFGVRNFHDIPRGLREILRVLRPGGRLYVLELSVSRNKIFGALFRFYFHRILPLVGGKISGDKRAYTYLPQSVDEFPSGKKFEEMLRSCGFEAHRSRPLFFGVAHIYVGEKR